MIIGQRSSIRQTLNLSLVCMAIALLPGVSVLAAAQPPQITIERPWMRFIIKARPAGGFFTVHNQSSKQIELVGASSTACGMLMLHQSKEVNGIEKMLPVTSVAIPAHGSVSFHPGGYHLMCMNPHDMKIGATVPVTLKFSDGQTATKQFSVTGPGGEQSGTMRKHSH